jgi:RsiW-degrading membrane proteinase PrsW (M82 family)
MLTQTLNEFGWLAAVFLVACAVCLITDNARRPACFYLLSFVLIIAALLWLYTTTPEPLSFLIPTSMNRTVDVFMVLAALATSHLIAALMQAPNPRPTRRTSTVRS